MFWRLPHTCLLLLLLLISNGDAFVVDRPTLSKTTTISTTTSLLHQTLQSVSAELENVPLPFLDPTSDSFIDCYADMVATIDGTTYTIGTPCDIAVALCVVVSSATTELVPLELDSTNTELDDVFPIAERIVSEEFGEELVLQRTPQTLTLVGELEDDTEDEEEDDDEDYGQDGEAVEVLLSFEHRDKEYHLVRLLDPILLVGKEAPSEDNDMDKRMLLTEAESKEIMPILEQLVLEYNEE